MGVILADPGCPFAKRAAGFQIPTDARASKDPQLLAVAKHPCL